MKKAIITILTMIITVSLLLPVYAGEEIWEVDPVEEDIFEENIWQDVYYDFIMNGLYLQEPDLYSDPGGFSGGIRFALWDMSNPADDVPELIVDNNASSMELSHNSIYTVVGGQLVRSGETTPMNIAETGSAEPDAPGIFAFLVMGRASMYTCYAVDENAALTATPFQSPDNEMASAEDRRLWDIYENHSAPIGYYYKEQIDNAGWDAFCQPFAKEAAGTDSDNENAYPEDYDYVISQSGMIEKYMGHSSDIVIPEFLNGVKVTGIGEAAFMVDDELKSIVIPDGVTVIGDRAFDGCSQLAEITIPDSVTSIGAKTFYNCRALTEIALPDNVISIGEGAFFGCEALTNIKIPNGVSKIENDTFYMCVNLTEVAFPDSVTEIGAHAFGHCKKLNEVRLPGHLEKIGDMAFASCYWLESVSIPDTVTQIGINPFAGCEDIVLTLSPNHAVFELKDGVLFEKETQKLIAYTYDAPSEYVIPQGTVTIGDCAFYGTNWITEIVFPDSLTHIGKSAFFSCDSLVEIVIPEGVTTIEDSTFEDCESIENVEIPSSITRIGDRAFSNCVALRDLNIPAETTEIGIDAFLNCFNLTILADHNTIGEQYCIANEISYIYPEDVLQALASEASHDEAGFADTARGPLQGTYETGKLTLVFSGFRFSGENDVTFYCGGFENSHGYYTESGSRYELTITDYDQGSHYAPQVKEIMNNCRITVRKIDDSSIGVEIEDKFGGFSFWQIGEEIYRK